MRFVLTDSMVTLKYVMLIYYKSAKRAFARFEGHNDPKQLRPVSQFLSGGIGGMVAQYVFKSRNIIALCGLILYQVLRLSYRYSEVVSIMLGRIRSGISDD